VAERGEGDVHQLGHQQRQWLLRRALGPLSVASPRSRPRGAEAVEPTYHGAAGDHDAELGVELGRETCGRHGCVVLAQHCIAPVLPWVRAAVHAPRCGTRKSSTWPSVSLARVRGTSIAVITSLQRPLYENQRKSVASRMMLARSRSRLGSFVIGEPSAHTWRHGAPGEPAAPCVGSGRIRTSHFIGLSRHCPAGYDDRRLTSGAKAGWRTSAGRRFRLFARRLPC
jgi:hypothetical protein